MKFLPFGVDDTSIVNYEISKPIPRIKSLSIVCSLAASFFLLKLEKNWKT